MKSKTQIAKDYLNAWHREDESALILLAENLTHESTHAKFTSKKDFFEECWGKFNHFESYDFINSVEQNETVVLEYVIVSKEGRSRPVCEWFFFEKDKIKNIKVYFS